MSSLKRKESNEKLQERIGTSEENGTSQGPAKSLSPGDIHVNQRYRNLVPRPLPNEYESLKNSISKDGQREAITVNEQGTVVDGHVRFKICKELRRDVIFQVRSFPNKDTEEDFVIESAVVRRQLNTFQKIKLAQYILKREKVLAKERQRRGTSLSNERKVGEAIDIVAKKFGIPRATFARGQSVLERATKKQILRLEQGDATINEIYNDLRNAEIPAKDEKPGTESNLSRTKEIVNPRENSEGEEKPEGASLDDETKCDGCHSPTTRGKLKETLLCEDCRRKLGMRW